MSAPPPCAEDPFPGSPDRVEAAVEEMNRTAQRLLAQAEALSGGVSQMDRWEGVAHEAFMDKVGDLPGKIEHAGSRYATGGYTLAPYSTLLRQARNGQSELCSRASDAQSRINRYADALRAQQQWEHNEAARARRALTDPSQGSPIPAHWSGPNNSALLFQAQQEYNQVLSDYSTLKSNFDTSANEIAHKVHLAAQVYADEGGISGFINHRKEDLKRVGKWLSEHGITLEMISDLLGDIGALFSLLALIPGPWSPIFAAIGLAAGLLKLAVDLPRVISGEKSLGGYLIDVGLTLLPFAGRGIGALAMKGGANSIKGLKTGATVAGNSWWSNTKLLGRAEKFQDSLKFTSRLDKFGKPFGVGSRGLTGHHFILSERVLTGDAARRTANAVTNLAERSRTYRFIGGVDKWIVKPREWRDLGGHLNEARRQLTHSGDSRGD